MAFDFPLLTSLQNPKVKQVIHLRKRRERDKSGRFIIEGCRELLTAAEAGHAIETLFLCKALLGPKEKRVLEAIEGRGCTLHFCTEAVFKKMSYRGGPDGCLAVAPQLHKDLSHLKKSIAHASSPLLLVAEGLEKPGNLGAILRSADAVGLDALIVCEKSTDIHNPNVVRASMGTLFTVPVIESESKETVEWLHEKGIALLAATPKASVEYTKVDMRQPIAIAVGSEELGLSSLWMDNATFRVKIPMVGKADSLNAATAATLLLYEAIRQRHG